ncbi:hypothetical protein FACS189445_6500 [Spirochaetia bacterium]|nr:hypothetical protein FACS189445_6500 [Spirochaetia bacterium]
MSRAGKGSIYTAIIFLAALLSGCDNYDQSIDSYIEDHIGMVRLASVDPAEELIIIPPASEAAPESTVTVTLENKQAYALRMTLLYNGAVPDPEHIRADDPNAQNQVKIHIFGAAAGKMYEDMLYDEYAKTYTENANFGLADLAYLELTGQRGKAIRGSV